MCSYYTILFEDTKTKMKKNEKNYFKIILPRISFHESELMLASFIEVLERTLMPCGQAPMQAPHRLQKSRLVDAFASMIDTALHGHTSWHAWQDVPLQILSSLSDSSNVPSNGLVISIASVGHISQHHEHFTHEPSNIMVSPVISGTSISSPSMQVEQICLIAFSGQTLLQTPQKMHLERSTSIELFALSTVDAGTLPIAIAPAGHISAQNEQ